MNIRLLQGELVRLAATNSETDAEAMARWSHDSEYMRLEDSWPARLRSVKQTKEDIREWLEHEKPNDYGFVIRTLTDDRAIGAIELDGIRWSSGDCFVGIGIGERECWGNGYGTDAMRVILHFAFAELNLHRVSLNVFEYNPRAIRSYEKAGFVVEGRQRQVLNRDGRRWDVIYMGILRQDWERLDGGTR
jgi:RimJ/RimL family protein N-acetyltransferase